MRFRRHLTVVVTAAVALLGTVQLASAQIVAFGSSTVQGRVAESDMWPAVLEQMLHTKGSGAHVINAGVYGERTWDALTRVKTAVPEGTRTVILVMNGFNDKNAMSANTSMHSPGESEKNIAAIKSYLKSRGIRVIDAIGTYYTVQHKPGMLLSDGRHLNVEGNREMARILSSQVR